MEMDTTSVVKLINDFFISVLFLINISYINNVLSFIDMQIKTLFLRMQSNSINIYRKTIK